jgi:outer membrane murein-binding lipoprotein Lpp
MDAYPIPPEVDARLNKVENDVSHLRCDVQRLTGDVERLSGDVEQLKTSVEVLKIDVAVIRSSYVTKADLNQAMHDMTMRMYAFGTFLLTASTAITYFIARNVH